MMKNSDDFSVQEALRLARSQTGQQLLSLLRSQNADALQQAMGQAAAGNYENAAATMAALLADPKASALLAQLGREKNG